MIDINNLVYTYSPNSILREKQNYDYIEKAILTVLKEQKVSLAQTKEIFDTIYTRLENNTLVDFID